MKDGIWWGLIGFFHVSGYDSFSGKVRVDRDAFAVGKSNMGDRSLDTLFFDSDGNGTLERVIIPKKHIKIKILLGFDLNLNNPEKYFWVAIMFIN
jgi:hypothetical protein